MKKKKHTSEQVLEIRKCYIIITAYISLDKTYMYK